MTGIVLGLAICSLASWWLIYLKGREEDAWFEHKRKQAIDPFYNIPEPWKSDLQRRYPAGTYGDLSPQLFEREGK